MYGVPSALVLLDAIQYSGSESSLPLEITKAALLRNLSVFISNLDTVATKTESNHYLSGCAAKYLSERLDAVLEPLSASNSRAGDTVNHTPETSTGLDFMAFNQQSLHDMPNMLFPGPMSVDEPEWTSWALLGLDYSMTSTLA